MIILKSCIRRQKYRLGHDFRLAATNAKRLLWSMWMVLHTAYILVRVNSKSFTIWFRHGNVLVPWAGNDLSALIELGEVIP